jgi:aminobenzoyl-glutamate transport protein
MQLTPREKKGLLAAVVTNVAIVGVFAAMVLTPGAPLHGDGVPTLPNGNVLTSTPADILGTHDAAAAKDRVVIDQKRPVVDRETKAVTDDGYMVLQRQPPAAPTMLDRPDKRWSQAIVPLIFVAFAIPGIVYGVVTGTCKGQKDVVEGFYHGIRNIVPVLAISFFMGQFVAYFSYSGLDRMLAFAGGGLLVQADLPVPLLLVLFVALVVAGDFAISGMLSKFGIMAPIFIPMFMMVGMSPELTTAAYRIGDSVVNIITPLNSYLLIILAVLQRYKKEAGLGTLISLMLPYSVIFFVVWTTFLLAWYFTGAQLGAPGPIHYVPPY